MSSLWPNPCLERPPDGMVKLQKCLLSASISTLPILQKDFVFSISTDTRSFFSIFWLYYMLWFSSCFSFLNIFWVSYSKWNVEQKLLAIHCYGLRAVLNSVRCSHLQGSLIFQCLASVWVPQSSIIHNLIPLVCSSLMYH